MKTTIKLTIALLLMLTVNNCTKIKERKKTTINLSVLNTITKEGSLYSGIIYKLEKRTYNIKGFSTPKKTEIVCEGITNSEGRATIEFFRVINHDRVEYRLYVLLNLTGMSSQQYGYKTYYPNIAQDKDNNAVFYVGEMVSLKLQVQNTNCFDANDHAVYKVENGILTDNDSYYGTYEHDGCFDNTFNAHIVEDYYPYTLTVTRNGQTIVTQDTFKIEQGMDTLKWYY